jgi:hypothetical protein
MIAGVALSRHVPLRCTPQQFQDFHLVCEAVIKMR